MLLTRRFALRHVVWMLALLLVSAGRLHAQKAEALLDQMTLEEKVGQMTQLTLQAFAAQEGTPDQPFALDGARLREALVDRHVGSLLNVYNQAMNTREWASLMGSIDEYTSQSRLEIPVLYGIDAVHGNNYLWEATIFPQNIGMAATWDTELVAASARITAEETRAVGQTWNFAPVLDVARNPLWSRFFETYGEDPYAVSVFGTAAIEAMQASGETGWPLVAATGKHFLGYSAPLSGKDRTPAWIPERMLREIFLPPFKAAFDAGLKTIMVNSSEINGIPVHADPRLLTELVRDELGFEGIIVTDWEDIGKLVSMHRVAENFKEAVFQSVSAGIDMAMVPYDYTFTDALIELVEEGRISESRIDESVLRILQVKEDLGLLEAGPSMLPMAGGIGSDEAQAMSLEAARESMTLLKNDGLLPHALDGNILLAGPAAFSVPMMYGSWTYVWQGDNPDAYPEGIETLASWLPDHAPGNVTVAPWGTDHDPDRIRAMAYGADVAVLALGERPSVEKPGDIESLDFPAEQVALVRDIAETGTPVVVVLFQNRPRIIRSIEPYADAILLAYLPGPHGAQAVTEVLDGTVNPSGHLPFTYPRFSGSLVPHDRKFSEQGDILFGWNGFHPQYPFGHGLSYTEFVYSDLQAVVSNDHNSVHVTVKIRNAGERAGADVAHLFLEDHVASVTPPVQRLRRFERVSLDPGESLELEWTLTREDLAFIGRDLKPTVEPGLFSVRIADQETSFRLP